MFFADSTSLVTNIDFGVLAAVVATIIAIATFWVSTRAARIKDTAEKYAVDAEAYKRGVEIYESTIETLRTEVSDLRNEIKALHEEIGQLRQSNIDLMNQIHDLSTAGRAAESPMERIHEITVSKKEQ